jgi:hypothetical protein
MKTGRDDLNAIFRNTSMPADEPVFILRAQDDAAADTVRDWAARHIAQSSPVAVVEQALRQADAMDKWPVKKLLNADHLNEGEAKQLVYAHGRRVWDSGKIVRESHATALMAEIVGALLEWGADDAFTHAFQAPGIVALIAKAKELKATIDG